METLILKHMETVRGITEQSIRKIPEEIADIIPTGFNNNIRWNFGHIVFIQERLVFQVMGEKLGLPEEYEYFFQAGTKPAEWNGTPPSLQEITLQLVQQKSRVEAFIKEHFSEKLPEPFTNKAGITFHTLGETFLFSFYHEALHMETIKGLYRAIRIKK